MSKVETKGFKRKRTNPKLKRGPIWTLLGYTFLSIPTHIVYSHPGPDKSETGLGIQRWDHVPNYRVFKSRRPGLVTRSVVVRFFIGTFQSVRQMCDNEYHIFKPWTSHELSFGSSCHELNIYPNLEQVLNHFFILFQEQISKSTFTISGGRNSYPTSIRTRFQWWFQWWYQHIHTCTSSRQQYYSPVWGVPQHPTPHVICPSSWIQSVGDNFVIPWLIGSPGLFTNLLIGNENTRETPRIPQYVCVLLSLEKSLDFISVWSGCEDMNNH